jgi:hypothetical protein
VHQRVDAPITIVDCGQGLNGLPVVGQVDPHEVTALRCRGHAIEGDDIPPMFQQVGNTRPAKLSAAPGYRNQCHCSTPRQVPTRPCFLTAPILPDDLDRARIRHRAMLDDPTTEPVVTVGKRAGMCRGGDTRSLR